MPSSLVAAFRTEVPARVRSRGEAYLHSGLVSLTERGPTRVVAEVRGRHDYAVVLRVDGGRLAVSCTCPAFDREFDPCKHVWATIVAVDRAGGLDLPAGAYLDPESPGADLEDADLDADLLSLLDAEADDGTMAPRAGLRTAGPRITEAMRRALSERMRRYWEELRRGRPGGRQGRVPSPPPPPSWQVFLAQVGPMVQAAAAPVTADALFYLFDITRSPAAGGVLIDLVRRQRKRSGEWSAPKAAMLTRGDLPALPPDDRHILQAVCGADTDLAGFDHYRQGLPVPQTFVLNPSLQADLLPRLCRTGRFVVRIDTPGAEGGVVEARLDWDPTPHVFVVRIDGGAEAGFSVGGVIRSAHGDRAPSDFLFITSVAVLSGPSAPGRRLDVRALRSRRRRSVAALAGRVGPRVGAGRRGGGARRTARDVAPVARRVSGSPAARHDRGAAAVHRPAVGQLARPAASLRPGRHVRGGGRLRVRRPRGATARTCRPSSWTWCSAGRGAVMRRPRQTRSRRSCRSA
jgi:hypothetical protein